MSIGPSQTGHGAVGEIGENVGKYLNFLPKWINYFFRCSKRLAQRGRMQLVFVACRGLALWLSIGVAYNHHDQLLTHWMFALSASHNNHRISAGLVVRRHIIQQQHRWLMAVHLVIARLISTVQPDVPVDAWLLQYAWVTSISHAHTVVWECCKDDHQSQWGMAKFDPQPTLNPWTDRHQIWNTWLRRGYPLPRKIRGSIRPGVFAPHIRE